MTAPKLEQIANKAVSTLDGAINNSVTSITVDDGSVFLADGNFRVGIEDELLLVTARTGNVLTVVRGTGGSTAASHDDGKEVRLIMTEDGLNALLSQNIPRFGQYAPLHKIVDNNNAVLSAASFTTINFAGSTTLTDGTGQKSLRFFAAEKDNQLQGFYKSAPTAPYTFLVGVFQVFRQEQDAIPGAFWRDSNNGKIVQICQLFDSNVPEIVVHEWTDETTLDGAATSSSVNSTPYQMIWYKLENDATNLKYSFSGDGVQFHERYSSLHTDFFDNEPDQIGFGIEEDSGAAQGFVIVHWSEE